MRLPLSASVLLLISQQHPQYEEAEQCADVVECAWVPWGGAVAQVWVAAVDAHPRQLLLLAVPRCGATAGEDDTQGRYEERTGRQTASQSGKSDELVFSLAKRRGKKKSAQVSIKY